MLADRLQWPLLIKGRKYIEKARLPLLERLASSGVFSEIPIAELLEDGLLTEIRKNGNNPKEELLSRFSQMPADNDLDRYLYLDLKLAITDNDLFKVSRMTEAAGIQVRFPFLDHKLAEFAGTVPAAIKMRGQKLRSFFKTAYADLLPVEIRRKKKHGFGLPIPVWLRTDKKLNEMMRDLVLSPRSVQRGYFRKRTLEWLIALHATDETSFFGTILWHLMMLELWHRRYWN
jgi:asparagine synthase (glutamine-hydrolysing)